jgi:release factor glutamine methyltransferase
MKIDFQKDMILGIVVTRVRDAGCVFAEDEARLLIAEVRTTADLAVG